MSTSALSPLENAIRESGEGWLIDRYVPPEKAIEHLRSVLHETGAQARQRFGASAPDFSEETIANEFARHPQQVRGFFQALGGTRTPDILLMAWRILQGMKVKDVQLAYRRQQLFELRVVLESPDGKEDRPYVSQKIQDFALLRHIGILELGGQPIFEGFYPFRVR